MSGIRRNQPCPCRSGRKYKHCHGAFSLDTLPSDLAGDASRAFQRQDARNAVRQIQQGYGKPIVSTIAGDHRIVAVGKRVFYREARRWLYFTDFLLYFLKETLGRDWGAKKQKSGDTHPLFAWLTRMEAERRAQIGANQTIIVHNDAGYISSIFRLAYGLYLLEHNDRPSAHLVKRLRAVETFWSATYETYVFAAFALAGFSMSWAETSSSVQSTPEFLATGSSGKQYAVEAKRKSGWRTSPDPRSEAFVGELRQWLRDQLHRCLKNS
ncbi:SEC-C domain-containing protein [Pelagibacterium flavum]|uniref:SEC-C domain-containing protein n=1 Tax=Pelagibacterium flavum TaxID=2984530 RepID=UPI0038CD92AE